MSITRRLAFLAAVAGAGVVADAAGAAYVLDKVAETGAAYSALTTPALNDAGVVAFAATAATGGVTHVYRGAPGAVQQMPAPTGIGVQLRPVDINNAGQIAFVARDPLAAGSPWVVHRFNPSPGISISTVGSGGTTTFGFTGGPAMDDAGNVTYVVNTNPGAPGEYLSSTEGLIGFSWAGPVSAMSGPHRNNEGLSLAVSPAAMFFGSAADPRVPIQPFTPTWTDPDTGATDTFVLGRDADAGDGGRAVFAAEHGGVHSLFVWDNGVISKVPGSAGIVTQTITTSDVPAINDLGAVAALLRGATPQDGRISVFGPAGEQRVVSVGDAFDGSTIAGLAFNAEGFNDHNQLAFTATLADGRAVNVLATVPEPTAAGALLVAAGAAALGRRRRAAR